MAEVPTAGRNDGGKNRSGIAMTDDAASAWMIREVLPLEAILMTYLRHNWRNASELVDLRQEIYVRVLQAAREHIPDNPKQFLLACARNHLINRVRREQIVPIEVIADLETLGVASDAPQPDRWLIGRDELNRVRAALDRLPPRMREAVALAYFEGLSGKEIAARMGISAPTACEHLARGTVMLAEILNDAPADRSAEP